MVGETGRGGRGGGVRAGGGQLKASRAEADEHFPCACRNQAAMNPRQTVFDAKRLIGRRFDDADVKKDMVHWPFKVVDKEGAPFIEVRLLFSRVDRSGS